MVEKENKENLEKKIEVHVCSMSELETSRKNETKEYRLVALGKIQARHGDLDTANELLSKQAGELKADAIVNYCIANAYTPTVYGEAVKYVD